MRVKVLETNGTENIIEVPEINQIPPGTVYVGTITPPSHDPHKSSTVTTYILYDKLSKEVFQIDYTEGETFKPLPEDTVILGKAFPLTGVEIPRYSFSEYHKHNREARALKESNSPKTK